MLIFFKSDEPGVSRCYFTNIYRTLLKSAGRKIIFIFLNKKYVVGTQKNSLNETGFLSTHNIPVC